VVAAVQMPVSPEVKLSADSTALIVCGTTCPTADAWFVETVMNQYITPTHPGQTITPVAVTTPEEYWPITGLLRLVGLAVGDPRLFGPGGAAWPDEPWWKLSGLFDLTTDQSIQAGVADLEQAMAAHGNDRLVIYGYSQGAVVANVEKQRLAEQYPAGTAAPDIDFVLGGDFSVPNGGLYARFPGLYLPVLDWSFNGPEPTNTQFHTDVITRQYDGVADFPLYPLNVIADLKRVAGLLVRAHVPVRRQPACRSDEVEVLPGPGHPRGHQLLLFPDRGLAVVRSAAHPRGARAADRRDRAVLPGAGGPGL
jgi:pimeloyl-ACP methyl ester carboxylesterase